MLEQILAHGRLLMYRSGLQIHESAPVTPTPPANAPLAFARLHALVPVLD